MSIWIENMYLLYMNNINNTIIFFGNAGVDLLVGKVQMVIQKMSSITTLS